MGSWLLYGLGAETDDLPGFIVLTSAGQDGAAAGLGAAMVERLSAQQVPGHSVPVQGRRRPLRRQPRGRLPEHPAAVVEEINRLNGMLAEERLDPEIQTRISQYELAFRMQTSVPELTDFSSEPQERPRPLRRERSPATAASPRTACWPAGWPSAASASSSSITAPGTITATSSKTCRWPRSDVDQACAALVKDLKQRGMLDDTLVIWGGEFGRTPMGQGTGRDHHILGFSIWLAGGGIKGGMTYGATDELGYRAVENVVHVHDLHATMLHLCGIDHKRLTFSSRASTSA